MNEAALTSAILMEAVRDIEGLQQRIADYKARFYEVYGLPNSNLLKEVLEQRAIETEAREYVDALVRSADIPDDEA